ncbi:LysR family transcriptional regulator [Propionibacterium australiense]|uniref:Transcription regulator HTH, LysR n=1 Tax=Propionibacterium australiense TaxID=119981 RepID=A0A383S6R2_9ACTN|nr:LysR family transcriptional regulator [Propionibacterium australiense]RLP09757.1 LysR family transcriptional regulator [Propionibacterium australiense]SYZ33232.1 Transcription regulator HTH, LysR [Propionibacterium australiense]VEH89274.1 Ben and cat operon transcriptional regulator [Propionibacterium australiense]
MEFRQLRYFTALARTLNFTRAAESLYISQSTLSQQIAALEKELGVRLFDRAHHQVSLTEAGNGLLGEAHAIITQVDGLTQLVEDRAAHAAPKRLRIGFDLRALGSTFLTQAVTNGVYSLRSSHPNLSVNLHSGEYDTALDNLRSGVTDLAFFLHQERSIKGRGMKTVVLYEDELAVAVRTGDELEDTPECAKEILLRRGVALLSGEGRGLIQAIRVFDELGVEPPIHFVADRNAMLFAVNSGTHATLLPLGMMPYLVDRDTHVLRLHVGSSALYVLDAWRADTDTSLIGPVLDSVREAFAP